MHATNTRVAAVETIQVRQGERLTSVETTQQQQGQRLASVETTVVGHGQQIAALSGTVIDHSSRIGTLEGDVGALKQDVAALGGRVDTIEKKTRSNTQGIAAAMAMPSLAIPAGKSFVMGMDLSTYDGMQAIGASGAFKLDRTWSLQGSLGASLQGGPIGARFGVRAAW